MGIGASEVDEDIGEPLDRRRTATAEEARTQERTLVVGRGRSLSGTLGELWRGLRGGDVEPDVEGGSGDAEGERERR